MYLICTRKFKTARLCLFLSIYRLASQTRGQAAASTGQLAMSSFRGNQVEGIAILEPQPVFSIVFRPKQSMNLCAEVFDCVIPSSSFKQTVSFDTTTRKKKWNSKIILNLPCNLQSAIKSHSENNSCAIYAASQMNWFDTGKKLTFVTQRFVLNLLSCISIIYGGA